MWDLDNSAKVVVALLYFCTNRPFSSESTDSSDLRLAYILPSSNSKFSHAKDRSKMLVFCLELMAFMRNLEVCCRSMLLSPSQVLLISVSWKKDLKLLKAEYPCPPRMVLVVSAVDEQFQLILALVQAEIAWSSAAYLRSLRMLGF